MSNLAIDLGETLLPLISDILDEVKKAVEWFSSLDDSTKERIVKIGLLVAALSPLLMALGSLITTVGTVLALAPALGAAFTVMTGPIGLPGPDNGADGGAATVGTENGARENPGWQDVKLSAVTPTWGDASQSWTSGGAGAGYYYRETNPDGTIED